MRMPGFTAASSLYKSHPGYAAGMATAGSESNGINPQFSPECSDTCDYCLENCGDDLQCWMDNCGEQCLSCLE